ncbi:MAG TPA: aconitate hydratase [Gammaproteobacteria bacterium]|nr:aconitate hydratase [Gammaproteobacteria bacterium]
MSDSFKSRSTLKVGDKEYTYFSVKALEDKYGVSRLPYAHKILLENLLRHEDGVNVTAKDVEALAKWDSKKEPDTEISFTPARVIMQDFTGVPAVVDLAAMRDAVTRLGGDAKKINPLSPAELVIDHSVQVDFYGSMDALRRNNEVEFERNRERYQFLRWGQKAFDNFKVVPPNTGIVHQVNIEHLARVVFDNNGNAYPDTVVGTDSHTTMVNGLGVLGWGVGGIEAEAAMLGQPVSMLIPHVIGFKLTGKLPEGATATDLVLTVTEMLRKKGVVGKFVEFFGDGLASLPLADRATIGNMSPEFGSTVAIFPIDGETIRYLRLSGRSEEQCALVEAYARAQGMWREEGAPAADYTDVLELDMSTVEPSLAGPKRPQDRIPLAKAKNVFRAALPDYLNIKAASDANRKPGVPSQDQPLGVAGPADEASAESFPASDAPAINGQNDPADRPRRISAAMGAAGRESRPVHVRLEDGREFELDHGAVVIAAITSCTNTSNPAVMLGAGLLARNAVARGLDVKPWVKTSLAPGSRVVTDYYKASGLLDDLAKLGFNVVGYGCTTCIGNSGPLLPEISRGIQDNDLVCASVLSGNRNFEGRIHPDVKMNFLASPPLVVAYALAGTMDIDLQKDALGHDKDGKPVYLKDIWPSPQEIQDLIQKNITSQMFNRSYSDVFEGDEMWNSIDTPSGDIYDWPESTYVKNPPYFDGMTMQPEGVEDIKGARVLALLGDSVTTDHISPAGSIKKDSPAGRYLMEHGVEPKDFNSYGSRRGNHEVMMRGTFANIRLKNLLLPGTEGGVTLHIPSNEQMSIYDAAMKYQQDGTPLVVIAGEEYGTGSSRDWAAKGTRLLGVRAVIAKSFERIHRSNLIGMGVVPLQFMDGEDAASLGLTGREVFDIAGLDNGRARTVKVVATREDGSKLEFTARVRLDTPKEVEYMQHGGILHYVLRQLAA